MTIFGPDISNFQTGLDIAQVAREGFDFIFCKVSEGSGYADPTWPGFRDAARANNLILAGYHYVRGDVSADAQANTFVQHLGDNSIPAMLDFEANSGGIGQFWAVLHAIEARGVHVALSYIPRWYWSQIGYPDISGVPGLIQSSYVSGGGFASALYPGDGSGNWGGFGGRNVDILQFTDKATIAGHSLDCNAFKGTRAQLTALLGGPILGGLVSDLTVAEQQEVLRAARQINSHWDNPIDPATSHGPGQGTLVEMVAASHRALTQGIGYDPTTGQFDGAPWAGSPRQVAASTNQQSIAAARAAQPLATKLDALTAQVAGIVVTAQSGAMSTTQMVAALQAALTAIKGA